MRKVIVTQRIDYIKGYKETRDALDQKLSKWLVLSDLLPVPVPNNLSRILNDKDALANKQPMIQNWLSSIDPDAILLSGGNDIGEYPERDATEYYLLDWANNNSIPVLGICRGLQIMATWAGSNLVKIKNHVNIRHPLISNIKFGNFPKEVNSYHNWGLIDCPKDFVITAHAEDNSIEAIKHRNLPWEAWMWHPEREEKFNKKYLNRFTELVLK
jgi:N5-(cytidine 5'-diphosphoramidyl)-L-glutamine hydrolase